MNNMYDGDPHWIVGVMFALVIVGILIAPAIILIFGY